MSRFLAGIGRIRPVKSRVCTRARFVTSCHCWLVVSRGDRRRTVEDLVEQFRRISYLKALG